VTDAPARAPLLELEGIQLSFKAVRAIENVGFRVRRHEVCAVIGPNGAGKSSVLNVVSGVYRPDAGQITFDGERRPFMLPRRAAQRGIARTFQNIAVFKGMSVLENVLTGTNLRVESSWIEQLLGVGRAPRAERRERQRAEEVLELLALQRYRQAPVGRLAYGLQKRVELGRALAAGPQLLLLDEPMAGMNADEKREMSRAILDVNRRFGTTIVLIEHDMRVVMDISDHVVVLDYGRVVGDGTPDEVRQNPDVLRAYLGTRRGAARAA
jgi:branched-chain amino acid transport system ATP-binding protein